MQFSAPNRIFDYIYWGEQNMVRFLAIFCMAVVLPSPALAYDWSTVASVAAIEGTHVPSIVRFWVTSKVSTCPTGQEFGSQLDYSPIGSTADERIANAQAVTSILMTAKVTGRQIKIFGRSSDCVVEFIYLV